MLHEHPEQHRKEAAQARAFAAGEGAALQAQLVRQDSAAPHSSYVRPCWDAMYLNGRYAVPINSNPFIAFEPTRRRELGSQPSRAGALLFSMLRWRQAMLDSTLQPNGTEAAGSCMDEFDRLFGTNRAAVQGGGPDRVSTDRASRHVLLLRGAAIYRLELVQPDGTITPEADVVAAIAAVVRPGVVAAAAAGQPALATLTAAPRDEWGAQRERLATQDPGALADIDGAVAVCCLDFEAPPTREAMYATYLHGGDANEKRWYDKLCLIVTAAGDAAVSNGATRDCVCVCVCVYVCVSALPHTPPFPPCSHTRTHHRRHRRHHHHHQPPPPPTTTTTTAGAAHTNQDQSPTKPDKGLSVFLPFLCSDCQVTFEHSPMDGSTVIRMMNDIWHDTERPVSLATSCFCHPSRAATQPACAAWCGAAPCGALHRANDRVLCVGRLAGSRSRWRCPPPRGSRQPCPLPLCESTHRSTPS